MADLTTSADVDDLLTAASDAEFRSKLGLGTAATTASTAYATAAQGATADSALQPDGDGSALTGITATQVGLGNVPNVDATDCDNHTSGTTNKVFTGTEQTKLAGIETGADVTDATNVAAAGAVMEADTSTASMSFVIDEDNMASDSATKVPTQQSVKAYVDGKTRKLVIGFTAFDATAVSTGKVKGFFTCPNAGSITAWSFVVDAGTATVKVWKIASGTAKPTAANAINTSGVAISSNTAVRSTTLTDFTTTTVTANDIFAFNIEAISGVTEITFQLEITSS